MRTRVLDYLQTIALGSYRLSRELPRSESGVALFIKNPKTIYVDESQRESTVLLRTLDGQNINVETERLEAVFSNDAKNAPYNYAELVESITQAKNIYSEGGFISRESVLSTNIEDDLLITRVEIAFTKIR